MSPVVDADGDQHIVNYELGPPAVRIYVRNADGEDVQRHGDLKVEGSVFVCGGLQVDFKLEIPTVDPGHTLESQILGGGGVIHCLKDGVVRDIR